MRSDNEQIAISSLELTKGDLKDTIALCGLTAAFGIYTALTSPDSFGVVLGEGAIAVATIEAAVLGALYASDKKPGGHMNSLCKRVGNAYEYAVSKVRGR